MSIAFLNVSPRWRFLFAILLLTGIAAWAFTRHETIQRRLESGGITNSAKANLLIDMRVSAMHRIKVLSGLSKVNTGISLQADSKQIKEMAGEYFELEAKLGKLLASSNQTTKDELQLQRKITETGTAAAPVIAKIQELAAANKGEEVATLARNELNKGPVRAWLNAINEMILLENELAAQAASLASTDYEHLRTQVLLMCAGVIMLGLMAAWVTFTRIGAEPAKA
ncbi:MAG: hypothetical protein RL748_730 [Pseudomonadota bacterium]